MSGVFFGGVATVVSVPTIGRAWAACDVGSNAANSMSLLFLTPLIWIAAALPWIILHGTLGRGHRLAVVTARRNLERCFSGKTWRNKNGDEWRSPLSARKNQTC
ncbi:hypothetical protein AB0J81_21110 [Streptomyces bobili]|uniref:hypothetical protein n=1 Tax=Streptomyces bobili TaxID=67280 RepID=UPI00342F56A1